MAYRLTRQYNGFGADRVAPERADILTASLHLQTSGTITGDSMKKIPLTRGLFAIVDDADYNHLSKYKWNAHKLSGYYYAERGTFVGRVSMTYPMHRVLMGASKGQWVDHVNGNTLDNRRCNLRIATPQQNCANRRPIIGCTSKYKGVSWIRNHKKWYASIKVNNKSRNLGEYGDEIVAARAYDAAAREAFGVFARTNFEGA